MTPLPDNPTKAETALVLLATIAGAAWELFFPRKTLPQSEEKPPQPAPGVYGPGQGE